MSRACSPFSASATTAIAAWALPIAPRPARAIRWSSAIRMRIRVWDSVRKTEPRLFVFESRAWRRARIARRRANEQLLSIREGDHAAVGAVGPVFSLVALHQNLGARQQRLLGPTAAQ